MDTSRVKDLSVIRLKLLARISQRVALISFILLSCVCLPGCFPIKVSNRNIGANGERNRKVDLTFLMAGSTRRLEVEEKLGWLDTGFKNQQLYWGRFSELTSERVALIRVDEKYWHERNLMIEFDENGITKRWEILDDKHLSAWLLTWAARTKQPRFDLASPASCTPVDCRQIKKVQLAQAFTGYMYTSDPDPAHFQVHLELKNEFLYRPLERNSAGSLAIQKASKHLDLQVDATAVYAFIRSQSLN